MPRRAYSTIGLLSVGAGTFLWGFGPVLVKLTSVHFLVIVLYRHLFSFPVFFVAWLLSRNKSKRLPWATAGVGGVLFSVHQIANFGALRYSTTAVVTIFFSLQPIVVGAVGRRVTGERTTARFYGWALVAVIGCAVLVLASHGGPRANPLGTVLAVTNLFVWSAYYLATKRARAVVRTVEWLLVMTIVSGVIVGIVFVAARQSLSAPRGAEWAYLGALGILPGAVGHILVVWAQPHVHAAASSTLILAVPIVGTVGTALLAHEPIGPLQAVGGLIALIGAGIAMRQLPPPVSTEAAVRFGEVAT